MKKYWIISIVWYSILLALKFAFNIYSGRLFIAFYNIHQLYTYGVSMMQLNALNEYKRANYPELCKRKTGNTYWMFSLSTLSALGNVDEEEKYPPEDEEYLYKKVKAEKWSNFHLFQFGMPIIFALPYLS